jgi:hypothetical protein
LETALLWSAKGDTVSAARAKAHADGCASGV